MQHISSVLGKVLLTIVAKAEHRWVNPYRRMTYTDYLTTAHWQRTRLVRLERSNCQCERCGRRNRLEVHHLTYERLGEELPEDLQVLCAVCHAKAHGLEPTPDDRRRQLAREHA